MLWLKALHIVSVVTWFAGLLYLPRLFVYHVEATESVVRERFKVMERKLLAMTNIGAALTLAFGVALAGWWFAHQPAYLASGLWFPLKLLGVLGLLVYHGMLVKLRRALAQDDCRWSSRALRIFNEVPALLLIAIVILVVVKPF